MFDIEKNVPLPPRAGLNAKFPFDKMQVGDSFTLPKDAKQAKTIASYGRAWAQRSGNRDAKFATRSMGDAVRVWRTA